MKTGQLSLSNHCVVLDSVSASFPEMTGDPVFTGPIHESKSSPFCAGGTYTDFRFECQVQFDAGTDDGRARFKVSLTFDGKTDPSNPATQKVTTGTALTVGFPSIALKGNVGKSVNICKL